MYPMEKINILNTYSSLSKTADPIKICTFDILYTYNKTSNKSSSVIVDEI